MRFDADERVPGSIADELRRWRLVQRETARLKRLWKKLVRMFHPDLLEHGLEKRRTCGLLDRKIYDRIMDSRIIFED
jgi:hypothetical protein